MAHLVLGTDGTWNKPDQSDRGRQVPSNVVKLVRAVDEHCTEIRQQKYYDRGVGTADLFDKFRGGVAGKGLFKNVREAYEWLIEHHNDDKDEIFLFGFSRGAFTARSLAGLLNLLGIPNLRGGPGLREAGAEAKRLAKAAATIYRIDSHVAREDNAQRFRREHACKDGTVTMLGVWDTVGALGIPTVGPIGRLTRKRHGFHDVTLGANVRNAYHALAINERRGPFEPTLWEKYDPDNGQTVEQVWFPGVHTNIGGGYVDSGLSDRALFWMIRKAEGLGLRFNKRYLERRIDPNWFGELRDSMKWFYSTCLTGCPTLREIDLSKPGAAIHFSAMERWDSPSRPDEMPENLRAHYEAYKKRKTAVSVAGDTAERKYHEQSTGRQRR